MTTEVATGDELERIRRACEELGTDEEMTELVLAALRHDRTLLDVMVANGEGVRDYVRKRVAMWEAIFNEDEECTLLSLHGTAGAIPAGNLVGIGDPGAYQRAPAAPVARPADASPGLGEVRPRAEERV
jgi:hypothetical protein